MNDTNLDIKFTQRFPRNLLFNVVYFFLNIAIGLLLVPFFLNSLGPAAYGLIPLATSITYYLTLVIDALNLSISRYMTVDLQRSEMSKANVTFNTALFGSLVIIAALIPVAIIISWFAPSLFNTGEQLATDVFLLFALIIGSMLISAWRANFMGISFAYNRLDHWYGVYIVNLVVQVVSVVALFQLFGPSLAIVGLSYFMAAIASFIVAFANSRSTCPYLMIKPSLYSQPRFKEILGMSTWVFINSIGLLLNTSVALLIVNVLFGEVATTEFSLAVTISALLIGIAALVTKLLTPMTYSYYSRQDREGLIRFSSITVKSIGLLMALPIALVCVFSPQLLTIWVGARYAHLAPLVWLCVAPVIFQVMVSCISPITVAYNRIRDLVMLTLPLGFANVIFAFLVPYATETGMYGVAIVGAITLVLRYGVVNPVFISNVVGIPPSFYMKKMLYGVGGLIVLAIAGIAFVSIIDVSNIAVLILAGSVISVAYFVFVMRIALQPEEKRMIRSFLPRAIQKIIPVWIL